MGHLAVVVGFGVVGATVARQLLVAGTAPGDIAAVDTRPAALADAVSSGCASVWATARNAGFSRP
jgi:hypothetical protein